MSHYNDHSCQTLLYKYGKNDSFQEKRLKSKLSVFIIVSLLLSLVPANLFANPKISNEERQIQKIKTSLARLSKEKNVRLIVETREGKKISGILQEVNDEYFVIASDSGKETIPLPYPQVSSAKKGGISKKTVIILGIAVAVFAIALTAYGISQTK